MDAFEKQIMIADPLRSATDLTISFGREQVYRLADLRAARPGFHIKGLDRRWITEDEYGFVILIGDGGLMGGTEVNTPVKFEQFPGIRIGFFLTQLVDQLGRLVIGNAREGRLDLLKLGEIAAQ